MHSPSGKCNRCSGRVGRAHAIYSFLPTLLLMMALGMACDKPLSFQLQSLLRASQAPAAFRLIPLCRLRLTALAPAPLLPRGPERGSCCRLRTALRTRPETRAWTSPGSQVAHPALLSPQHPRGGVIGALHQPSPGRWQCLPADSSRSSHGCGSTNPTTASDRLVLSRNTLSSAFAQPLLGKVALKKKLDVWRLGISSGTSLWHPESWRSACALPCNGASLSLLQGQTACPPRATPCSSHFGIGTCTGHKAGWNYSVLVTQRNEKQQYLLGINPYGKRNRVQTFIGFAF